MLLAIGQLTRIDVKSNLNLMDTFGCGRNINIVEVAEEFLKVPHKVNMSGSNVWYFS